MMVKKIAVVALAGLVLYFGAVAVASRNYWAGLFWETYLTWIPSYDVVRGPRHSLETHAQYDAATKFIRHRSRTASTATFCPFAEVKFGVASVTGQKVMVCYVDMQNRFGAMLRSPFMAVFQKENPRSVEVVEWSDGGNPWR